MIPWPWSKSIQPPLLNQSFHGLRKWLQHSSHPPGQISDTGWPHWASRWIVQFWRQSHKPCCPQQNRKPWLRTCSSNILPNSVESELPNFNISISWWQNWQRTLPFRHAFTFCPGSNPWTWAVPESGEPYFRQWTLQKTYLDVVIICYNVAMCAAFSDVCSFVSRYLESLEGLSRPAH